MCSWNNATYTDVQPVDVGGHFGWVLAEQPAQGSDVRLEVTAPGVGQICDIVDLG